MITLLQLLLYAAVFLVVPIAIVIGHRHATGPILVSGISSLGVSAIFWLLLGGLPVINTGTLATLLLYGGSLLQVAAWTLAINSAAVSRSWGWVLLLMLTGYISFAALLIAVSNVSFCLATGQTAIFGSGPVCLGVNPVLQLLFNLSRLLVSIFAVIYGLAAPSSPRPRRAPAGRGAPAGGRAPVGGRAPAGLAAPPIDASSNADTEPDPNGGWMW
ncbi:MAG: hypothetical protein ACLQUY_04835 [Ktedonobacterales bacterium]